MVRGGVCPTLTGDHQNRVTDYTAIVCECYIANRYAEYIEGLPTLRASGGDTGGGGEGLIVYESLPKDNRGIVCE